MSELKNKFIHSVTWTASSNVGVFLINFLLGIWLARILGPEAYGVIGMLMAIIGFGKLFMDFGFGEAMIQNQEIKDEDFSTLFWFNILLAVVFFLLFYFLSGYIANFYDQPSIKPISRAISSVFIFNSFGIVQRIKLEKELKFREITITEIISSLMSMLVALFIAHRGYGVWALVFLNLTKSFIYSTLIWSVSKWIPTLVFNLQSIIKLSKFSFALLINGLFHTIATTLDKILIGKYQGNENLGVYTKSVSTVRMPVIQLMSAISRVIYPTFAKIQSQDDRMYKIYVKFIKIISTVIFPIMVIFFFYKREIILLLFGTKWIEMISIFGIFTITAGFLPFNILSDSVVKAKGIIKHLNYITWLEKPIAIICVIVGVLIGSLNAISISVTLGVFVIFIIKTYIVSLSIQQSFTDLILEHLEALYFIIIPVFGLLILLFCFEPVKLYIKIFVTVFLFSISFFLFRKSTFYPFLNFVRSLLDKM